MRKGRFATLSEESRSGGPLSWLRTLLLGFARHEPAEAGAAERRLEAIAASPFYLLAAHIAWVGALISVLPGGGPGAAQPLVPGLALVLAADLLLIAGVRFARERLALVSLLSALIGGAGWALAALSLGGVDETARGLLLAGASARMIAFMPLPAAMLAAGLGFLAAAALAALEPAVPAATGALMLLLLAVSLSRARSSVRAQARRIAESWETDRAARLLSHFEESGAGWFWETNADGALTYISAALARELGRPEEMLIGRPFGELLLVEQRADEGEGDKPTLGFHLSARFPFAEILVVPNARRDICWSLTGSPAFDEIGRFLGFRGHGMSLSDQRRREIESERRARNDSLTGLPNRAGMEAMLKEALDNAASRKEGCALFMIDLDRFKQVNDTLGHPAGDALLKEVALRLSAAINGSGQVGRLGGDEFQAVLPGLDEEGALAALAERLIGKITKPYRIHGHAVSIGASVGIAISRPGKSYADALVKEADLALYAAKGAGRGTFRFFEPEMHAESIERQILENDLRGAVAKGQLELVYQPIVDVASEDLLGFEALVRWAHPVRGLLAPAEFLPIAESNGLASGIGEWVIRTACAEAAKWPGELRVAVNLSEAQLAEPGLVAVVTGALAAAQIDPARLELEIEEGALLADCAATGERLGQLRQLGVRLVLDGFGEAGTGLLSLHAAPLDGVKLPAALLQLASQEKSRSRAVLASIGELSRTLGMEVTAKGIETLEELSVLRSVGCERVQGFLFGRPMPPAAAAALAGEQRSVDALETAAARPPRHRLIRRAALGIDGKKAQVRLRNISSGGAMIECAADLAPGQQVTLDLAGAEWPAEIRWVQDGRVGLKFAQAFDLQRLGKTSRKTPQVLRPEYLDTERSPDSPWAARQERLTIKDVRQN